MAEMNPLQSAIGIQAMKTQEHIDARKEICEARKVAQDFEALFVQEVFKSMRKTIGGEHDFGHQMYSEMFDEQLSHQIAQSGIGLADVLEAELSGIKKSSQDFLARADTLGDERADGRYDAKAGSPDVKPTH